MSSNIYMTGTGSTGNSRFYRAFVTADLLGGWSLVREWGERGAAGQSRVDWVENLPEAMDRLRLATRKKSMQGFEPIVKVHEMPSSTAL